jgi:hypothetical protein
MRHMNWRTRTFIIGAVAGLAIGLAAAFIVIKRSEQLETLPELTPGDGVKVALGILGVLRLVSDIAEKD